MNSTPILGSAAIESANLDTSINGNVRPAITCSAATLELSKSGNTLPSGGQHEMSPQITERQRLPITSIDSRIFIELFNNEIAM